MTPLEARLRRLARRLPTPVRARLWRLAARHGVARALRPVHWGNLRRLEPFSSHFGLDRGTSIDRRYITAFFAGHADDIHGRVLEVKEPEFSAPFGHDVSRLDLVDIDRRNEAATIVADLSEPGSLPPNVFDCAVVPQTLQHVADPAAAVANLWQSLAAGGVLLISVPATSRVDPKYRAAESWRFLPPGLRTLLQRNCATEEITVVSYGNVLTSVGFLLGLSAEELQTEELDAQDPDFPLVTCGRARKPSTR